MRAFILAIVLVASGCSLFLNPEQERLTPLFDSIQAAMEWDTNYISYKLDQDNYGKNDYWASPKETLNRGCGDCEDYAILLMYEIYTSFGGKSELALTDHHAIVKYAGKYYDVIPAKESNDYPGIIAIYSYDFIMNLVNNR